MNLDFLAIGDITTDAIIRLTDAEVRTEEGQHPMLCMNFADKIPYEYVEECRAVGNAPNAAVSAARLGLRSGCLSYIGDDASGEGCKAELEKNGVDTSFIRTEVGMHTNYHYVLWYGVDRTILVKHNSFSYNLGDIGEPKWIYLSSLGDNSLALHTQIADYLETHPNVKLAFQPGTFQIKLGTEALARIYAETDVFVCNVEEVQMMLGEKSRDIPLLIKKMASLGPKIIFITDGVKGAYGFDGTDIYFLPIYPENPVERTGAGDAFASAVVSAFCLGKSFQESFSWGPINSQSVVKQVGAQKGLLTQEKLLEYLKNAPSEYVVKKI